MANMANYVIVPNEKKCRELLKDLPVCIERVYVDEERCRLEVEVRSSTPLDRSTREKIREAIKRQIPTANVIELCCFLDDDEKNLVMPDKSLLRQKKPKIVLPKPEKTQYGKSRGQGRKKIWEREIQRDSVAMSSLMEETPNIVVEGQICYLETKELKTGRTLITFDLTDFTCTYPVKIFLPPQEKPPESIKEGSWFKVQGRLQYDTFSKGLVIMPQAIQEIEPKERKDFATNKRVELHLHTKMSSLDAVINPVDAINMAKQMGHSAIAITDHGVVQAFPEAMQAAKKAGIKVLYGVEGYLCESEEKESSSYHIILLAKNQKGMFNLYKLISLSHLNYFYRHPRIPRKLIDQYREGLIIGSACEAGELYQAILHQRQDVEKIASFYDYLEIQPIGNNSFLLRDGFVKSKEELQEINNKIYNLGKKLNRPVVATGDVHFLNPKDEVFRRVLMMAQGYHDADNQPPLYYRSTEEMLEEFAYLGQEAAFEVVVENTNLIADMIEEVSPISDEYCPPYIEGADKQIEEMTYKKAHSLYGKELPKIVKERLDKELKAIISNGFAVLYLIAHKLVIKSLEDGYLVGSRGSVGSSLVATMCDITEVNPLPPHYRCPNCKHSEFITDPSYGCGVDLPDKACPICQEKYEKDGFDIPFEIFMGFKGDKVPDIDLNFSGIYQSTIHKYTEELFGQDHVFRAGTIGTLAQKTAYGFVAKYMEEHGKRWPEAEVNRIIRALVGIKRTTGQHPGGMVVVPEDREIYEFTPVQHPANDSEAGTITTHFDFHSIDANLVKLDILGHDDPTMLRMLSDLTGVDVTKIPLDDPKTMEIFSSLDSLGIEPDDIGGLSVGILGIPEFGTNFVRRMVEETKPTTFAELVRISGFSHGTDVWTNNAQDLIREGKATLSEAIATRDDIMNSLIQMGMEPAVAFNIMERVRKGRGLTDENIEEMKKVNTPEWFIESCKKISYLFPKAHAVAYVTMAFRIAYFKVHYPLAYYTTYFSVRATDFPADLAPKGADAVRERLEELKAKGNDATEKESNMITVLEIILEAIMRGVKFCYVDIYNSDAFYFKITKEGLLPPFVALDGVGASAAEALYRAREEGEFVSVQDLQEKTKVSKNVIETLRIHGCLEGMPESSQMSLF